MIFHPSFNRRQFGRLLVSAAATGGVAACSTTPTVPTNSLEVAIEADPGINVNTSGTPSPIVLRIYELKSLNNFNDATFFELLDGDTARLGTELVSKREFEMKPGQKQSYDRETPTETGFIGVIAGFREIDSATWRASLDINQNRTNSILVHITALTVTIELTRSRKNWL